MRKGDGRRERTHREEGIVGESRSSIVALSLVNRLIVPHDEMAVFREALRKE